MSSAGALPKSRHDGDECEGCGHWLGQRRLRDPASGMKGRVVVKGRHTPMVVEGRVQAPLLCPRCRKLAQGIDD